MANKKNGFWTFIFSLIPGAGEMYMGFFKQGLSLMGLCAIVSIVASFLGIEELMILLPLIWFYSFFHVHHLRSLPPEEFHALEDKILFFDDRDFQLGALTENRKKPLRWCWLWLVSFCCGTACWICLAGFCRTSSERFCGVCKTCCLVWPLRF